MSEEEVPVPEYDQLFRVEFKARKPPNVDLIKFVNDLRKSLDTELDYSDLVIKGKTIEQLQLTPSKTVPYDMWRVVFKEDTKGSKFSEVGDIEFEAEGTGEVEENVSSPRNE